MGSSKIIGTCCFALFESVGSGRSQRDNQPLLAHLLPQDDFKACGSKHFQIVFASIFIPTTMNTYTWSIQCTKKLFDTDLNTRCKSAYILQGKPPILLSRPNTTHGIIRACQIATALVQRDLKRSHSGGMCVI